MVQQEYLQRINSFLARFYAEVKGNSAIGFSDLYKLSETMVKPILGLVFGLSNLENLNFVEKVNFPAIDLGDKKARVAIQVTAESNREKIIKTLEKFIDYKLYSEYDRLIIYVLTERQKRYSDQGLADIINGQISFSLDDDVIDYRSILKWAGEQHDIDLIRRLHDLLEKQFGEHRGNSIIATRPEKTESVHLNMFKVSFPETLYIADLVLKDEQDKSIPKSGNSRMRDQRQEVWKTLERLVIKAPCDWVTHGSQLITFHNLDSDRVLLNRVVDRGTITPMSPWELYSIDENYENTFRYLLRSCLQYKLYRDHVQWQYKEGLFIFCPEGLEKERKIRWKGGKGDGRIVYQQIPDKRDDKKVFCHKHLGFIPYFMRFEDDWYLVIKSEWFFSCDGFHKSKVHKDRVAWLKREENNSQVHNQVKAIADYLQRRPQADLLKKIPEPYLFLELGEAVNFKNAPYLPDIDWLPSENQTRKRILSTSQTSLF